MDFIYKIRNLFKKVGVKRISLFLLMILVIIFLFYLITDRPFENDSMDNTGIKKISYRTYTKDFGWSKWSKNGITSGNMENEIQNIEFRMPFKNTDVVLDYYLYSENEWIEDLDMKKELKNIKAIKLASMDKKIFNNYNVCYRTYNKTTGWLKWSCNGTANGTHSDNITAIEVKIVPRNVIMRDYLKEYDDNNILSDEF